ncbi:hypothetical protein [Burkholderia multivorans]|uniref:hypothetical protein n=1 Tax=Burkholderia multivorans TaxID=87883 RepID=UPI001C2145F9|nr:hypothetical protein [Burkholderia multivorans]
MALLSIPPYETHADMTRTSTLAATTDAVTAAPVTPFRLAFPECPTDTVTVAEVQSWLDSLPPLYGNPMEANGAGPVAAFLYSRSIASVQTGLQSLDDQNWTTARLLCGAADALLAMDDETQTACDTRYGSAPKPPRERAARLFATLARARMDLLALPDGIARTGVSNALDDAELLARDVIDDPIPANVLAALDRMCTPLDESVLGGATARADAHSMQTIRQYMLGVCSNETSGA